MLNTNQTKDLSDLRRMVMMSVLAFQQGGNSLSSRSCAQFKDAFDKVLKPLMDVLTNIKARANKITRTI